MRIGMMADVYKPHISGVTNFIALNKRVLEAGRDEVFVFTLGGESHQDDEANVVRSPAIPLSTTGFSLGFRYTRVAQRKLATMDIAHVHHPFVSGRLALRYCGSRGTPVVFTNHTRYDLYAQAYLPMVPEALSESFLHAYMPNFCDSCDLVIAPSAGLLGVLRSFGVESPIEVIPNGIDLAPFQNNVPPKPRSDFGWHDEACVFIYVGRVAPEKDLVKLLRAFVGAQSALDNLRLLIVGDGPELDNLRDRVRHMGMQGKVLFTGAVTYSDVPLMLHASDVFVTASTTEVHPLSLIEGLACGLPALGIRSPGISDTIEDGVCGFVSEDDIASFTAKMVRLAMDAELRRRMSAAALQTAARYDIHRTAGMLRASYEKLLERGRGRVLKNNKRNLLDELMP